MLNAKKIICTLTVVVAILQTACKEGAVLQSSDIPAVDNISTFFTDTSTVIANNTNRDSFQTGGLGARNYPISYYAALGNINTDPSFGSTVASFALQLTPPKLVLKYPTNGTLITDSLILSIPFRGSYGDTATNSVQTFNVYRLTDTLDGSKKLYNTTSVNYDPTLLGTGTIDFKTIDSVTINGKKRDPQIRIALSGAFADLLRNLTDTIENKNAASFNYWLKGLYITPADTNTGKTIGHFYVPGITMTYYFRNIVGTKIDTTQFIYKFDPEVCRHYTRITRNFTKANPNALPMYLNTGNANGDPILFAQSDFGAAIDIKLPNVHKMPNAIINKAELEFTVIDIGNTASDKIFKMPKRLYPVRVTAIKQDSTILVTAAQGYVLNSELKPFTNNGVTKTRVLVNINNVIQKAVTLKDNNIHLRFNGINVISDNRPKDTISYFQGNGRVVFGGNTTGADKVKLNIIYTKIK